MAAGNEAFVTVAPEFFVRDVAAAARFYVDVLGFVALHENPTFAVLALGQAHVLLAHETLTRQLDGERGRGVNVRIMVDDVDAMYRRARDGGAQIVHDIAERDYGLRDFIVADVDGYELRFATPVGQR